MTPAPALDLTTSLRGDFRDQQPECPSGRVQTRMLPVVPVGSRRRGQGHCYEMGSARQLAAVVMGGYAKGGSWGHIPPHSTCH